MAKESEKKICVHCIGIINRTFTVDSESEMVSLL